MNRYRVETNDGYGVSRWEFMTEEELKDFDAMKYIYGEYLKQESEKDMPPRADVTYVAGQEVKNGKATTNDKLEALIKLLSGN